MPSPAADLQPYITLGLDYAGVAVFAASGAMAAARKRQDLVTFIFFATVTGVGGGTLRDLLLRVPVFWVQSPGYFIVCVVTALAIWLMARGTGWRFNALLWLDAIGLAAYSVVGAHKAMGNGTGGVIAIVMGILTASFGGIVRDVLAHEPSILLRREIYISAAFAGATTYVALGFAGVPLLAAAASGAAIAFIIRAGAIARGWSLPEFNPANGKEE